MVDYEDGTGRHGESGQHDFLIPFNGGLSWQVSQQEYSNRPCSLSDTASDSLLWLQDEAREEIRRYHRKQMQETRSLHTLNAFESPQGGHMRYPNQQSHHCRNFQGSSLHHPDLVPHDQYYGTSQNHAPPPPFAAFAGGIGESQYAVVSGCRIEDQNYDPGQGRFLPTGQNLSRGPDIGVHSPQQAHPFDPANGTSLHHGTDYLDFKNNTFFATEQPTNINQNGLTGMPHASDNQGDQNPESFSHWPRTWYLRGPYEEPWSAVQVTHTDKSYEHSVGQEVRGRDSTNPTRTRSSEADLMSTNNDPTLETARSSMSFPHIQPGYSGIDTDLYDPQPEEAAFGVERRAPAMEVNRDPAFDPLKLHVNVPKTPQVDSRIPSYIYARSEPGPYLAPTMDRRPSSSWSIITDAPSPIPPPIHDTIDLKCGKTECNASFTGRYARGNRGRHWRITHGDSSFMCEDNTCARKFNRSDARLKHYRKNHPNLASSNTRNRRTQEIQEVDLSNMSSWT